MTPHTVGLSRLQDALDEIERLKAEIKRLTPAKPDEVVVVTEDGRRYRVARAA